MNVDTPIIELPRLERESAKAYRARVEYVTMGPDRSLEKARQRLGKTSPGYRRVLQEWSERFGWVQSAKDYDYVCLNLATQKAADSYRANLEAHRDKAMSAGQSLYLVAGQLLNQLNTALGQPRKIKGEDGKVYTLHGIELNSTTLTTVSKALQIALDLEAHSLAVDKLLPMLEADSDDDSEQ